MPFVARQCDRHTRLAQPARVGLALIAQRIVLGRDHQSRRQPCQTFGCQGRGVGMAVVRAAQVLVPEPEHRLAGEHVALAVLAVRGCLEVEICDRAEKDLEIRQRDAAVARHQGDHGRQVAAGAVAADGDAAPFQSQRRGAAAHPGEGGERILGGHGKAVLRRTAVVDRDQRTAGGVGQQPAKGVVRLKIADDPAAAVVVHQHRQRAAASGAYRRAAMAPSATGIVSSSTRVTGCGGPLRAAARKYPCRASSREISDSGGRPAAAICSSRA